MSCAPCACSSGVPGAGSGAIGQLLSSRGFGGVGAGGGPNRIGHRPLGRGLQDQHQHGAERDGFEIAGIADQPGQEVLQLVAQEGDSGGAQNGAVDPAGAAEHRHQQIFGAGADAERARRYRALEMRVEPSGQTREHRGIDEHHQLGGGGVDAKGFGGAGAAPKRADGAADAAAEQVLRRDHRKHHGDPDHHEIFARIDQRMAADPQRRNAGKPVMGAEPVEVAEQIEERDAPGDGAERQIVTGQPHRDRADQAGDDHGHDQRGGQRQPWRDAEMHGQHAGGVGAEADKGGLSERRHAADAGQQHEADRDQAGDADIVEQRDPVVRQQPGERRDQDRQRADDRDDTAAGQRHSVSSACGA